jgi:hypothetical protein
MKAPSVDSLMTGFWPSYLTSLFLLAVFVLASVVPGCGLLDDDTPFPDLLVSPGDPFNLREGQSARLRSSSFTVTFVRRTAESRCPTGVQAKLIARYSTQADTFLVRGFFAQEEENRLSVVKFGHRLEFERLDPYPVYQQNDEPPVRLALRIFPLR